MRVVYSNREAIINAHRPQELPDQSVPAGRYTDLVSDQMKIDPEIDALLVGVDQDLAAAVEIEIR